MSGVKISQLPAVASALTTDIFPVVQAGVTSQETLAQVQTLFGMSGGILDLAHGGTNANLTASNGGIFYSTATAGAILAGTATAGKVLQSGATAAPTWSTPTYPSASGTAGQILRSNATNNVYSTSTFADTYAVSTILYASSSNAVSGLATANNGLLVTGNTGIPSLLAGPAATGRVLLSNAAAAPSFSTAQYPSTAGTSGNVIVSDGTNFSSSATTGITALGTQVQALNMGTHLINAVVDPVSAQDAATKNYVDSVAQGRVFKDPCAAASTTALTVTYANGSSGVGATLTNATTQAAFAIDGYSASVNDRILIKDQASTLQNGIYVVTTVGTGASNWVLTRSTDMDAPAEFKGATTFIIGGTANAGRTYTETATVAAVGTDAVTFTLTGDATGVTSITAGTGLSGGTITTTGTIALNATMPAGQTLPQPILQGVTDASSAGAGVVGEVIRSTVAAGSAVPVTTATATDVTSVSLTAGDWDVYGSVGVIFAGNAGTQAYDWISLTSATLADASVRSNVTGIVGASIVGLTAPSLRVNVSTTTSVYLSCYAVSASGITACGDIWARRTR